MEHDDEEEEHLEHLEDGLQVLALQELGQFGQAQYPEQFQLLEDASVGRIYGGT
jgi:hypothetical protein